MNKIKIYSTGQICTIETEPELDTGREILVEAEGIIEPATVLCNKICPKQHLTKNEGEIKEVKFIRLFTDEDTAQKNEHQEMANKYLDEAKNKVFRHGLDMKILNADLSYDEKKLTFYFTAQGRIDFRSLVSDMAGDFKKIIRLQQVGPRDEARLFGGYGKCGQELCCAKFLNNLESITLEMAESQDLQGAKSNKLAGCCGKLMCCLSFENNIPKELKDEKISSIKKDEVVK